MIRFRRRNTFWLSVLAIVTTIGMIAAAPMPSAFIVQFFLLSLFAISAVASTVEIGRERETIINALRRAPVRQRVSPQAKEAGERARSRGGFVNNDILMMDVGLIAIQSSYEGMAMRRTRNISKDDDGARPFVTVYVDPEEADRNALVRFEIQNQFGDQQFVHEMRVYLRQGEMNLMTDHHLPLAGNPDIQGSGDWDLKVFLDGNLVAIHNFMLTPSMNERQQRLTGAYEVEPRVASREPMEIIEEKAQEKTPRLQDLLQQPSSTQKQAESPTPKPRTGTTTRRRR